MDMKSLLSIFNETETNELLEVNDSFDIELGEDLLIETGVLELAEDGVIVAADEDVLKLLEEYGVTLEDTDWSKYDSPAKDRKQPPRTDYNIPTHMRKAAGEQPKTGFEKRRASLIKQGIIKAEGEEVEESGLQAYLGKKKYGEEGMKALQKAGREGASKEQMAKLRAKYDKLDEFMDTGSGDDGDGDDDMKDRIIQMYKEDGLRETEIAKLEGISELEVHKIIDAHERGIDEAKYQGREVPLGKPMAGDVKKSKVYVKKPNGKVVKVNFGDKKMRIKKSNPKRRKSFRARHNCKNPGPRWKARYWSCRAW